MPDLPCFPCVESAEGACTDCFDGLAWKEEVDSSEDPEPHPPKARTATRAATARRARWELELLMKRMRALRRGGGLSIIRSPD